MMALYGHSRKMGKSCIFHEWKIKGFLFVISSVTEEKSRLNAMRLMVLSWVLHRRPIGWNSQSDVSSKVWKEEQQGSPYDLPRGFCAQASLSDKIGFYESSQVRSKDGQNKNIVFLQMPKRSTTDRPTYKDSDICTENSCVERKKGSISAQAMKRICGKANDSVRNLA